MRYVSTRGQAPELGFTEVLLAGTLGRGVFTLVGDADSLVDDSGVLSLNGTGGADTFRIVRSADNASLVEIFANSTDPIFTLPLTSSDCQTTGA